VITKGSTMRPLVITSLLLIQLGLRAEKPVISAVYVARQTHPFTSSLTASENRRTRKPSRCFAKATNAYPRFSRNSDQSLLAPTHAIPSPALGPATDPSPVPPFAALPPNCDAGGVADLNPDRASTGLIGAIDPLGDDALGASRQACAKTVGASSATCSLSRMPALTPRSSRANAALRSTNGVRADPHHRARSGRKRIGWRSTRPPVDADLQIETGRSSNMRRGCRTGRWARPDGRLAGSRHA
jgi:hypothetical protein